MAVLGSIVSSVKDALNKVLVTESSNRHQYAWTAYIEHEYGHECVVNMAMDVDMDMDTNMDMDMSMDVNMDMVIDKDMNMVWI